MKKLFIILSLFLFFINNTVFAAEKIVKKDLKVVAQDGFALHAVFEYPNIKGQKSFSTVVLLHSLGYSSEWWETLPQKLLDKGYAVLMIDLRGNGNSVYNATLTRVSWKSMTNKAYAKYPDDVIQVIEYVKKENARKAFFNNWAVVGSDIGASTAILSSSKIKEKPKTLVLLSPVVKTKGLFVPVKLAELGKVDIFSISGTNDLDSQNAQDYLSKFAQAEFTTYTSPANSTGMLLLKNDPELSTLIAEWIHQYLK